LPIDVSSSPCPAIVHRGQKLLKFIGHMIVNGPDESLGATGPPPSQVDPVVPVLEPKPDAKGGPTLREIYLKDGPKAFAKVSERASSGGVSLSLAVT
jgi:pyruvate carboxylase